MAALDFIKVKEKLDQSILSTMDADIVVNENAQVWVLHSKPFENTLDHLEYYNETGDLYFAGTDGSMIHYGMLIPVKSRARMAAAQQAHLFLIDSEPQTIREHRVISIIQADVRKAG